MRGVQDPTTSAANDKSLLDQLTHVARGSVAHNIDPAIAGVAPAPVPMMGGNAAASASAAAAAVDADGDKKGAKRELSTSKRAAQNRAAQRAFRQRKEGHIKKLEEQVRDYGTLLSHYKRLEAENLGLRDYIIALQGRLIDAQGEIPAPPLNIDLNAPREDQLPPAIQDALAMHGTGGVGGASVSPAPSNGSQHDPAPPAPMHGVVSQAASSQNQTPSQLQGTAAQAVSTAKGARRSQRERDRAEEKSIEERTDPALK